MPRSINPNTTARDTPPAPNTSASLAPSHPGAGELTMRAMTLRALVVLLAGTGCAVGPSTSVAPPAAPTTGTAFAATCSETTRPKRDAIAEPGERTDLPPELPATVARTHVGFMGCHGALNGLRVASAFTAADPRAVVLLCAVELCSLHYHYGWDPGKVPEKLRRAELVDRFAREAALPDPARPAQAIRAAARTLRRHVSEGEYADVVATMPADVKELLA